MSADVEASRADGRGRRWLRLPRRSAAVGVLAGVIAAGTCGAALASVSAGRAPSRSETTTRGPAFWPGPPELGGTGKYAFFYNQPGGDITVAADGYIQFPAAGPHNERIVTASGGDHWTFTRAGTYTVAVCVPFQAGGSFYQVVVNGTPLAGSNVGGYNQEPYCETVALSASAGDSFGIQNPQGTAETVAGFSDSQLLILQIS
jgi:hypothetical protein